MDLYIWYLVGGSSWVPYLYLLPVPGACTIYGTRLLGSMSIRDRVPESRVPIQ